MITVLLVEGSSAVMVVVTVVTSAGDVVTPGVTVLAITFVVEDVDILDVMSPVDVVANAVESTMIASPRRSQMMCRGPKVILGNC